MDYDTGLVQVDSQSSPTDSAPTASVPLAANGTNAMTTGSAPRTRNRRSDARPSSIARYAKGTRSSIDMGRPSGALVNNTSALAPRASSRQSSTRILAGPASLHTPRERRPSAPAPVLSPLSPFQSSSSYAKPNTHPRAILGAIDTPPPTPGDLLRPYNVGLHRSVRPDAPPLPTTILARQLRTADRENIPTGYHHRPSSRARDRQSWGFGGMGATCRSTEDVIRGWAESLDGLAGRSNGVVLDPKDVHAFVATFDEVQCASLEQLREYPVQFAALRSVLYRISKKDGSVFLGPANFASRARELLKAWDA